ncbi:MAG: hypothetical protein NTY64_21735 [Deltaproteobacteria bacterium]|nr:hypothetical protein [Deltaproteobacteria bacterium]
MWFRPAMSIEPGASYLSGVPPKFAPGENSAFFIGHATVLVHLNEHNFLTDPLYLNRLYILNRHQPPGIPFQDLPLLDTFALFAGENGPPSDLYRS